MSSITLDTSRPFFIVKRDGEESKWEYDVVTIKIEMEQLKAKHGLKDGPGQAPTLEYLEDLAQKLEERGLTGCTTDIALRINSVVLMQFQQLARSIQQQMMEP